MKPWPVIILVLIIMCLVVGFFLTIRYISTATMEEHMAYASKIGVPIAQLHNDEGRIQSNLVVVKRGPNKYAVVRTTSSGLNVQDILDFEIKCEPAEARQ